MKDKLPLDPSLHIGFCSYEKFQAVCNSRTPRHEILEPEQIPFREGVPDPLDRIAEEGVSPFKAWYEHAGCTQVQISDFLGISLKQCRQAEETLAALPVRKLMTFCEHFCIHPIDLIDPTEQVASPVLDLLIDMYHHFEPPLSPDMRREEEMQLVLECEADVEETIGRMGNMIETELNDENKPYHVVGREFLTALMVNDGNPALGGFAGDDMVVMFRDVLTDQVDHAYSALVGVKKTVREQTQQIDIIGDEYYGPEWDDYKSLIRDTLYECGEEVAYDTLMNDLLPIKDMPDFKRDDLWEQIKTRRMMDHEKNRCEEGLRTAEKKVKDFDLFCRSNYHLIKQYNNRQMILGLNNPDIATACGQPDHEMYLTVKANAWTPSARKLMTPVQNPV